MLNVWLKGFVNQQQLNMEQELLVTMTMLLCAGQYTYIAFLQAHLELQASGPTRFQPFNSCPLQGNLNKASSFHQHCAL